MIKADSTDGHQYHLLSILLGMGAVILLFKLLFAFQLDLYSDEIFYWQASRRPALAYSDLPFMTALMAGLGNILGGQNPLAVRSLFILLSSFIPALVFWLARPLVTRTEALQASILALCLPLGSFLGLLAVPDVPLVFTGLLFIGMLERATRTGQTRYWLLAGLVAAAGFNVHYRFALYPLAGFIALCAIPSLRPQLARPVPWLAVLIMVAGLYPMLRFNLQTDLSGLGYHLVDRHPWSFQTEGFLHIFKQAGLVTPPLYIALLVTLVSVFRSRETANESARLIAMFSVVHLLTFMLAAPWADNTRTSIHWPLSAYFPLLVFLPRTLRKWQESLQKRVLPATARRLVLAIPGIGFAGALIAFVGVGSQAFNEQLRPLLGPNILSTKMAGWEEFNHRLDDILSAQEGAGIETIITDNYYTGAQIEFAELAVRDILNLDEDKAVRDGRRAQYSLWGMDSSALSERIGKRALLITEDSTLSLDDKIEFMQRACQYFDSLTLLKQEAILSGEKRYSFYIGRIAGKKPEVEEPSSCPLPSRAWIDTPAPESVISGNTHIAGWVLNTGVGVSSITLLVDGEPFMAVSRNISRPDVVSVMSAQRDPDQPLLGFATYLDTQSLEEGWHRLSLEVISAAGERQVFRETRIRVEHQ